MYHNEDDNYADPDEGSRPETLTVYFPADGAQPTEFLQQIVRDGNYVQAINAELKYFICY